MKLGCPDRLRSSAGLQNSTQMVVFLRVVAGVEEKNEHRMRAVVRSHVLQCSQLAVGPPSSASCFAVVGKRNAAVLPPCGAEPVQVGHGALAQQPPSNTSCKLPGV